MKKQSAFFGFFISLFVIAKCFASDVNLTPFAPDMCRYGEAGSWAGACACYYSYGYSGRYCDEAPLKTCQTNKECQTGQYCLPYSAFIQKSQQNKESTGACFLAKTFPAIKVNQREFYISQSLMNKQGAEAFCQALGKVIQKPLVSATRQDLACDTTLVGCVDKLYLSAFQKQVGTRGFLWLDNDKPQTAYYFDLNDGNLYNMDASSGVVSQALCVTRKN